MAVYCHGCGKPRDEALVRPDGAYCIVCGEDPEEFEDEPEDDDQEE